MRRLALALLVALPTAAAAQDLPPLSENGYVNDRLIQARVADRIRKECPTINARFAYAYGQARALQRWALDQGYSQDQIDTFLDSDADKKRIKAAAEAYLADNGVVDGDAATFCALGEAEIAAGSVAGSLIYVQ
jgi:hypothetical protein